MVLVLRDSDVSKMTNGYGFFQIPLNTLKEVVEKNGFFVRRSHAEGDDSLRQLIPYVVVKNKFGLYLMVKRLNSQRETRLHGFYSLGIGGHINDTDEGNSPWLKFLSGMEREIEEEIEIKDAAWPKYIGVIRENVTPVSRVHLGIVFTLKAEIVGIREKDKFLMKLVDAYDVSHFYDKLETWSRIAFEAIEKI